MQQESLKRLDKKSLVSFHLTFISCHLVSSHAKLFDKK